MNMENNHIYIYFFLLNPVFFFFDEDDVSSMKLKEHFVS